MLKQKQGTCLNHGSVLAQKQGVNHVLHLLLSLVTCGIWVFMWIFLTMKNSANPYRCPHCGTRTR